LPIINHLKQQGLLVECSSPYNTPILAVHKDPNKWRLVQDLQLINKTVNPLHPIVPKPYTLKNAFFYIPLHPDSQPLFALKDPTNSSQQLASQFVVLLEQHMELGSLGTTSAGSLFRLLLILLFGPCIINTLSRFISKQVQWIKFQLLVKEYSPLSIHEPSNQYYWEPLDTTCVNP
jgi:hypothetical protein